MQDQIIKKNKWEFDDEVAACFDDMLERSIPEYWVMRNLTFSIGKHFVRENTNVIDLGCSNGSASLPFVKEFSNTSFHLCDVSDSFLNLCKIGFSKYKNVNIYKHDIKNGLPISENCSLIISCLTLQFIPIEYREKIVNEIYQALNNGGALILVEKVIGSSAGIDDILVEKYYNMKKENLYTQEQISAKRKILEKVMIPIKHSWNIDLLKSAGFKYIDSYYRILNFCGILAIK